MTIGTLPTTIRATIGPKVIAKAPELFQHDLLTVLHELLQNARRAGATRVTISTAAVDEDQTLITIVDNGTGIDDPRKILTFGDSGWDLDLDTRENAAGMGFFSLGNVGCSISSLGWRADLSPAVFRGIEEAVIRSSTPSVAGTQISFVYPVGFATANRELAAATCHYPVTTTIDGKATEYADFLADAIHIETIRGVRAGVIRERHSYAHDSSPRINFFGLTIPDNQLPSIELVHCVGGTGALSVRLDVVDAPGLKLVLPARNNVIRNAEYHLLQNAALDSIYHYASTFDHQLPYDHFLKAQSRGIDVGEPRILLQRWIPKRSSQQEATDRLTTLDLTYADASRSNLLHANLTDRRLIVNDLGEDAGIAIALYHALANHEEAALAAATRYTYPVLLEPRHEYKGYETYDGLRRLVGIKVQWSENGQLHQLSWDDIETARHASSDANQFTHQAAVDDLALVMIVRDPATKAEQEIIVPSSCVASDLDFGHIYGDLLILTDCKVPPSVDDLVTVLVESCWIYDEDGDTWDTQIDHADSVARAIAHNLLLTAEQRTQTALAHALRVNSTRFRQVRSIAVEQGDATSPRSSRATITLTDGSTFVVDF